MDKGTQTYRIYSILKTIGDLVEVGYLVPYRPDQYDYHRRKIPANKLKPINNIEAGTVCGKNRVYKGQEYNYFKTTQPSQVEEEFTTGIWLLVDESLPNNLINPLQKSEEVKINGLKWRGFSMIYPPQAKESIKETIDNTTINETLSLLQNAWRLKGWTDMFQEGFYKNPFNEKQESFNFGYLSINSSPLLLKGESYKSSPIDYFIILESNKKVTLSKLMQGYKSNGDSHVLSHNYEGTWDFEHGHLYLKLKGESYYMNYIDKVKSEWVKHWEHILIFKIINLTKEEATISLVEKKSQYIGDELRK